MSYHLFGWGFSLLSSTCACEHAIYTCSQQTWVSFKSGTNQKTLPQSSQAFSPHAHHSNNAWEQRAVTRWLGSSYTRPRQQAQWLPFSRLSAMHHILRSLAHSFYYTSIIILPRKASGCRDPGLLLPSLCSPIPHELTLFPGSLFLQRHPRYCETSLC